MSDKYLIGANTRDTAQSYVDYLHNATHDGGRVGVVVPDRRVVAGNNVATDSSDDYNGYFKIVIKEEIEELPEGETLPEGEEPKKKYYLYVVDGATYDPDYKYDEDLEPSESNVFMLNDSQGFMAPYKNEIKPIKDGYKSISNDYIGLYVFLRVYVNVFSDRLVLYPDIIFTKEITSSDKYVAYQYLGDVHWYPERKEFRVIQRMLNNSPNFTWAYNYDYQSSVQSYLYRIIENDNDTPKPLKPITGPTHEDNRNYSYYLLIANPYTIPYQICISILKDNPVMQDYSYFSFHVNDTLYYCKPFVKKLPAPKDMGDEYKTFEYYIVWSIRNIDGVVLTTSEIKENYKHNYKDTQTAYMKIATLYWYRTKYVLEQHFEGRKCLLEWNNVCTPLKEETSS